LPSQDCFLFFSNYNFSPFELGFLLSRRMQQNTDVDLYLYEARHSWTLLPLQEALNYHSVSLGFPLHFFLVLTIIEVTISMVKQDAREYRTLNSIRTSFNVPGLCCLLRPSLSHWFTRRARFLSLLRAQGNTERWTMFTRDSTYLDSVAFPGRMSFHFFGLFCSGFLVVRDAWVYRASDSIGSRHDTPGLWCLRIGYSSVFLDFYFYFILALPRGNFRRKGTAFVSYSAEPLSHLQGPALVCEHGQHSWRSPSSYKYVDPHTYCNLGRMRGMLYLLRRPLFG